MRGTRELFFKQMQLLALGLVHKVQNEELGEYSCTVVFLKGLNPS